MSRRKIRKEDAAESAASSLPLGDVTVKFTCPAFRHKGVEYKSADVEQLASEGDEHSLLVIAELVAKRSGIIEVVKIDEVIETDVAKEEGRNHE